MGRLQLKGLIIIILDQLSNKISDMEQKQRNLSRSFDRLRQISKTETTEKLLPALYYTASLLDNYLSADPIETKAQYYYLIFNKQIELFSDRIQTKSQKQKQSLGKSQTQIFQDIHQISVKYSHLSQQSKPLPRKTAQTIRKQALVELQQRLSKIREFYKNHNLDECIKQINQLQSKAKQFEPLKQSMTKEMKSQILKYREQYEKMIGFYDMFNQTQGWIFDKQEDNIKADYRIYEQQRTIAVRIFAQIQIQMLPFLALACEIDLVKHIMPFIQQSKEIKNDKFKAPRNLRIGYSVTSVPLLADRECHYYAVGYDRITTTGSVFMYSQSFEQNKQYQQKFNYQIDCPKDKVLLKIYYFCLEYQPISRKRARVRIVTKVDFKLSFLPLFIISASARQFSFEYFLNIIKNSKKFQGSKWEQKVKQNPQMYQFFQKKIEQYFGKVFV